MTFTSTYVADGPVDYARDGNPTWTALERALGDLEGGAALAFASGLAAVAAVAAQVPRGGTVVLPRHAYSGTHALLAALEQRGDLTVRRVDIADTAAVLAACDGADLLALESVSNPMMEVVDLAAVVGGLPAERPMVMCDNTFATPLLRRPLELGADVVVHSATKYLSGHSDVLLGATVTADTDRGRDLQPRLHRARTLHGGIPGPMETWLVLRGMRTLHVRLERASANAKVLAARLAEHPAVERVRYPGFGAMLAIEVADDGTGPVAVAEAVCAATRVWTHSTSLGGVESQLERRRRHDAEATSVPGSLLRLSVGIEDVEDLWRDLDRALRWHP